MKKPDLKKLALMGLASGAILSTPADAKQSVRAEGFTPSAYRPQSCEGGQCQMNNNQKRRPSSAFYNQKTMSSQYGAQDDSNEELSENNGGQADNQANDEESSGAKNGANGNGESGCGAKSGANGAANGKSESSCGAKNGTKSMKNGNGSPSNPRGAKPAPSGCGGKQGCGGSHGQDGVHDAASCHGAINFDPRSEHEFVSQLNAGGKKLYESLSYDGKQLAIRLAKQFPDKNQAVREASNLIKKEEEMQAANQKRRSDLYK